MTAKDDDDERRRQLLKGFGISSRHIAEELAQNLRQQYDGVVQEGIPDHLRALIERIGLREAPKGHERSARRDDPPPEDSRPSRPKKR